MHRYNLNCLLVFDFILSALFALRAECAIRLLGQVRVGAYVDGEVGNRLPIKAGAIGTSRHIYIPVRAGGEACCEIGSAPLRA